MKIRNIWRVHSLVVGLFAALSLTFAPALAPEFNLAPVYANDDDDDDDDKDKDDDGRKAGVHVLTARTTLQAEGTAVECTYRNRKDAIIVAFNTDNTRTEGSNTDFQVENITIAGSPLIGPNGLPVEVALNNAKQRRDMLRLIGKSVGDVPLQPIPLNAKERFVVTFATENGFNNVVLKMILGVISSKKGKLRCEEVEIEP